MQSILAPKNLPVSTKVLKLLQIIVPSINNIEMTSFDLILSFFLMIYLIFIGKSDILRGGKRDSLFQK